MFRYFAPFVSRICFAVAMFCSSPSSAPTFTPSTSPPCSLMRSFRAFISLSSSTQGLHSLNQKFTTVTAFSAKTLLSTLFPSRSFPSNCGNAVPDASLVCSSEESVGSAAISSSILRICSASDFSVSYSASVN